MVVFLSKLEWVRREASPQLTAALVCPRRCGLWPSERRTARLVRSNEDTEVVALSATPGASWPSCCSPTGTPAGTNHLSREAVCATMRHRIRRADRAPGRCRAGGGLLGGKDPPAV